MLFLFFFFFFMIPDVSPAWSDNSLWEIQHLYCDNWTCFFSLVLHNALIPIDEGHGDRVRFGMKALFIV